MSSRDPMEYELDNARKGRLSFLLNDEDDDSRVTPVHGSSMQNSNANPLGRIPARLGSSASGRLPVQLPLSSTRVPGGPADPPALERTLPTRGNSSCETSQNNVDKRGVRKKRQRKFICDTCTFGFYTNSDLQKDSRNLRPFQAKHISSVHLLLRPYECSMCDKKFGERSNATKHFKSVHERQKNAACEQCHKVFAFRDGLVRHVRLVHDNVRNFHCQYPGCGQAFKQSAHLKKHEQVHTKARVGGHHHGSRSEAPSRKEGSRGSRG